MKLFSILAFLALALTGFSQTGNGYVVYSNKPTITSPTIIGATLTTPALGAATATSVVASASLTATHYVGTGTAPTAAYGAAAGTSPTAATFDSTASDSSGLLTMTMGSATTTGIVATITFAGTYATAPHVVLFPANQYAATASPFVYVTSTATTFVIHDVTTAIAASQPAVYFYKVEQ